MRIIIFDDHKLFGESLKRVLLDSEVVDSCDFVSNEISFYNSIENSKYDIVILDINLKGESEVSGFEVLVSIKAKYPKQKVVILSSYDMPLYEKKAFENGATDFINKSVEVKDLILRLEKAFKGSSVNSSNYEESLTEREKEILKEICKGKIKKELAKELYISERTLYNHIRNIYDKLGVSNSIEAYNKAIEHGYIEPLM